MHPPHSPNNPLQVLSHAERLAREQGGSRMGLVFQGIATISLGVLATKEVINIVRDARDSGRDRNGQRHR